VGSVRELEGKTIVGASLLDSLMNIDDVLVLRDVKAWVSPGAQGLGLVSPLWRVNGHDRFKGLVAELSLFLHDAERELARLEASLPWQVVHGEHPSPAREALLKRLHDEFVVEFIRYAEEIHLTSHAASDEDLEHLKDFSRRYLQAFLLQSPCLQRAFHKPLGYPGDYEVMRYMYENLFAGPTLFAKSLNLAVMSTRSVAAVRARKDLIKQRISTLLDRDPGGAPLRILAIAAGPAEEIYELLLEREAIGPSVEIVLFDQDTRALSFAYSRLRRVVDARWPERVRVVYRHDSIKRLLRDPHIFDELGQFDIVFSCGLFDYLQLRTAVALCRNLFSNLTVGATLCIGNMVPNNPNRWIMEMHLDWALVYRTRSEMMDFARLAVPDAKIEIAEEKTGLNPFVCLSRT
jgi:extracellular factor (EF) 3-hydroxypalmitic acid methyl ester biosynthesis protein